MGEFFYPARKKQGCDEKYGHLFGKSTKDRETPFILCVLCDLCGRNLKLYFKEQ